MAIIETQEAKDYLRVEHAAEDTLIAALILAAVAAVEGWLGRPIESREVERVIDTCAPMAPGRYSRTLFMPAYPIETLTSVEDGDGVALDLGSLRVNERTGVITRVDRGLFCNPPYTVTADVGLEAFPEYTDFILPAVRQAVLDVVADLYQRRNPAAMGEREGGGIAVQYSDQVRGVGADVAREDLITPRTAALLAPWRIVGV